MKKIKFNRHSFFVLTTFLGLLIIGCKSKNMPEIIDNGSTNEIIPQQGMDLYGLITDQDKKPLKGIVVTDGYTCVMTDEKGIYQMKKNDNARFVYYTTPADYQINTASETVKMANFYKPIQKKSKRYDFNLTKLSSVETSFTLICIGDPQVTSTSDIDRFSTETMQDIKKFTESCATPIYGISLGDMVGDKPALQSQIRRTISSTSMPVFTTIGNHDKVVTSNADEPRNSSIFCDNYGPVNYSFDRGDVHFICMDDVVFTNATTYSAGFTDEQVSWLRQDLSYVPKNKMVIMYYHIPLRNSTAISNRINILNLLSGFAEVHLMCGHTHYTENLQITSPISAYEHIHSAACGAWWHSVINGDGTPNGYAVYEITGNSMKNWYYKSVNYDKGFQIRLYKGDASFGGSYGYFSYGRSANTLIANVWNADEKWQINVYENGVKKGAMTKIEPTQSDAWTLGYHIGVLGRNPDNYSQPAKHLFFYQISDTNAKIEVEAIDRFGNVYRQNQLTTDLSMAKSY